MFWFFTSQSTVFQSCWDRSSWVKPELCNIQVELRPEFFYYLIYRIFFFRFRLCGGGGGGGGGGGLTTAAGGPMVARCCVLGGIIFKIGNVPFLSSHLGEG